MRTAIGVIPLVVVLALAGCVGANPIPTLPPSPTTTPVFASEDEALAAAEDAYAAYLEMSNLISSEGGVDPERIAPFAVGEFYDLALEGFETLRENGWRFVGESTIRTSDLQYASLEGVPTEQAVAAYICIDVSGVDVLDAQGVSVVSSTRPELQAFEVFFDLVDGRSLVPSMREVWEPEGLCGGG